ncbi:MAG: type IX secretion system membrane protein PorP/SprF [Bacteroidetes bacterium]|nr:type IX secretion system membrane protein PorP/SprF [Bacteroidota bacterium]
MKKYYSIKISMMKKWILACLVLSATATGLYAQQDAHYGLYMFNGLYLNPAYTGSHEVVNLMGIYRNQWAGVDGSPQSANISVDGALRRNSCALGLVVSGDQLGLTRSLNAMASFAYRIPVRKSKIALGISAGGTYYMQRNTDAIPSELTAQGYLDNTFAVNKSIFVPNVGAGIYVYSRKYYVGFSVPHILPMKVSSPIGLSMSNALFRQYNHYLLTAGVVIGRETSVIKVRPSLLVKYVQGLDRNIPDFDASVGLLFADRFWLGGTYRLASGYDNKKGTAFVIWTEMKLTQSLKIGYAFDWALSGLNTVAKYGSHDVMLGYEFIRRNNRYTSPRYLTYF